MRTDASNISADRRDLRADRADLRADGATVHDPNPALAQRTAHAGGATQPVSPKTMLSASTLANNAAENSKKNQTQQSTHQPWYHWIW
jgi:hypothetical protein